MLFSISALHAETNDSAGVRFSQIHSSLFVGEEHVPVVPVEAGTLGAATSFSAGVAGGTAVLHVAAAHRLRRGQRDRKVRSLSVMVMDAIFGIISKVSASKLAQACFFILGHVNDIHLLPPHPPPYLYKCIT